MLFYFTFQIMKILFLFQNYLPMAYISSEMPFWLRILFGVNPQIFELIFDKTIVEFKNLPFQKLSTSLVIMDLQLLLGDY